MLVASKVFDKSVQVTFNIILKKGPRNLRVKEKKYQTYPFPIWKIKYLILFPLQIFMCISVKYMQIKLITKKIINFC